MTEEHPVLFNAVMVRAILDGRKTQTRRILKPQPFIDKSGNFCVAEKDGAIRNWGQNTDGSPCVHNFLRWRVRHQVGDRLWVRDAWTLDAATNGRTALYKADGQFVVNDDDSDGSPWRPSIHMPRWASRITLEVTDVRVQRLQDISEEDAIAEGAPCGTIDDEGRFYESTTPGAGTYRSGFAGFWELLYGRKLGLSWDDNPWVVATTFRRVQP